ncbi:bifunctional metallophosphatase/5'-nucleotidase [Pseudodesulfovibrio sediminis]|uniref:Multifunctional 2',3'-cyclic-nucleotide 2'-phosphodiesterase/5'-nucleotidase/3'-nucleotidase n=1 Tax=Pseudodesulfovibrio sediminis TaxID=2810563 RepID=A0ABN6EVU0_9BACT|nr:5'-nucleotidase C-terminal domain-containing protein [Pseudodesulfovibrio sediminis]BCS89597.1 multifunctional 2',3'-cyclic-nucleotide 2'-phosphodiesterase/5'-nucleotidase/3'-nucleotidase [Pseudodesulfovibrio sediminis]
MKKWFAVVVVCIALLVAQPSWSFDLTLLHVNDTHSYLDTTRDKLKPEGKSTYVEMGSWARLTSAVKQVRRERQNVALLHAGDVIQGDLYFMKYGGQPEMEFLNRLQFDAMVLGNHEFDKGPNFLIKLLQYTQVSVLSANIDAGQFPALEAQFKPYTILNFGTDKVGIIGLTTKETPTISSPGALRFEDEAATARKYVAMLERQGVNKIVLLTHVGFGRDKELAAKVPGVDVVVGGHSHTLLGDPATMKALGKTPEDTYPVTVKGANGDPVYVVTAWKWARILGRLDVTFNKKGVITAAEGKPILLLADSFRRKNAEKKKVEVQGVEREALLTFIRSNPMATIVAPDAEAEVFLTPFKKGVQAMRNEVIGVADVALPHIREPGVDEDGQELTQGSLIAPLVCQSMLDALATTGEPADIALTNGGGVRESVPQGNISVGTAYTLMPFNNTLVVLTMTGAQLTKALEGGVERGDGAFPYVAGARYSANMNLPEGSRVTSVDVMIEDGRWERVRATRAYRVVTNSFLASGGDGYVVLKNLKSKYDTGFGDAQSFIKYVKKKKNLMPLPFSGVTYITTK